MDLKTAGKSTAAVLAEILQTQIGGDEVAKVLGHIEYAGNPTNNVTPEFRGQVCFDTSNSKFYDAVGTAAANWAARS
jgi:hypothetical protein